MNAVQTLSKWLLPSLLAAVCGWSQLATAQSLPPLKIPSLSFALIGDVPYSTRDETTLKEVLNEIGKDEDIAFIIHDGDIKGGQESCSDTLLKHRKSLLDAARQPLILIPGDNEWTDCHRASNGSFDPVERLNRLRELFFADDNSLGQQKMKLTRQSEMAKFRSYRENVRWEVQTDAGLIQFVGLNVPGSNNNYLHEGGRNGEFEDRREANRQWLARAASLAKQQKAVGLVIVIQANPEFENKWAKQAGRSILDGLVGGQHRDGYLEFKRQLLEVAKDFPGQILFVHGDTHLHKIDKPLKDEHGKVADNFTRLETYGYPFASSWVKVTIDGSHAKLFDLETSNSKR